MWSLARRWRLPLGLAGSLVAGALSSAAQTRYNAYITTTFALTGSVKANSCAGK